MHKTTQNNGFHLKENEIWIGNLQITTKIINLHTNDLEQQNLQQKKQEDNLKSFAKNYLK